MTAPAIRTKAPGGPASARRVINMGQRTQRQPNSARPCHNGRKPKGPVRRNTSDHAVAAPTEKRGFVMSEFVRSGFSRCGMVLGRWACPRGWPHGVIRVLNICPPAARKNAASGFLSHNGAKTMTQAFATVRTAAPILSLATRRAAPIQSHADTNNPEIISLHIQAENALAGALHLLRSLDCDPAKMQQATGRAIRAATLLKRASAAQAQGVAA